MPLLSVIMASKNENISFLKQCTDSILNQSFKDFNFYIIIDNNDKNINFLKNLAQSILTYEFK